MADHIRATEAARSHITLPMRARRQAEFREQKVASSSNPLGRSGAYATSCAPAKTWHLLQLMTAAPSTGASFPPLPTPPPSP